MNQEGVYEVSDDEIDIREIIIIFWKWKRMIVSIVLLAVAAGFLVSTLMKPVYKATATLYLGNFNSSLYNDQQYAQSIMLTEENLKKNQTLAGIIGEYPGSTPSQKMQSFAASVSVVTNDKTKIVEVSATHTDPRMAAKIVDLLTSVYLEKSNSVYDQKRAVAQNKINNLEKGIKQIELEIITCKNQLARLGTSSGQYTVEQEMAASRLQTALIDSENQKIQMQDMLETTKDLLLDYNPASVLIKPLEPAAPVSPNKKMIVAVSGLLSLMGSCFLAFVLESLKNNPIKFEMSEVNS